MNVFTLHWKVHDHTKFNFDFSVNLMVLALNDFHVPSQFHGHGPWP